jgi:excinuclease ABC subunit C
LQSVNQTRRPSLHLTMGIDHSNLELPREPGVYLFKRSDDRVLYVGKATDLRSRVRSYFSQNPDREMVPRLVKEADKVDFIVTQSPSEALVLERELIRSNQPRYNSMLKDGKSFPFIAMTSHEKPRIMYTRHPPKDARIWGPFPDAGAAKLVVKLLRRHFGMRDKTDRAPFGFVETGGDEGYSERVRAVESVLDGNAGALIERLQSEMDEASEMLNYERAARVRDMIGSVQGAKSENVVSSRFYQDCDAVGFSSNGDSGCLVILHAKEGIIRGQVEYQLIHRGDVSDSVSLILSEHYANRRPPKSLLVPSPLGDSMTEWLSKRRLASVEVRVPMRGELAKLRSMADRNAEIHLIRSSRAGDLEKTAADEGAALLSLDTLDHIVCFDMSQTLGKERVGASVVMRKGRPSKEEYRTYRVRSDAQDDLRMMSEVVERWAKRQDEWPNLLLLDGGETHLSTIERTLEEMGLLGEFSIAALAKREETLHMRGIEPILLDRRGRVLVHARDEAHRFSNTFHKKRRGKGALADPLEEVEGLGAKKIQSLLRHFGGMKGIEHASVKDLRGVPGIGKEMAERIRVHLHR